MSDCDHLQILHVDDNPDITSLTADMLEREIDHASVMTATSVSEGLERLVDTRVDCIVSDYDMPRQNGLDFLDAVREDYPNLPFILFTGKGSEEIASDAISAGVTDYLQKGTGTDQYTVLANRIENAVDRTRAHRERQRQLDAIETAREGISILDEDGRFIYVNQAYADLYGYDSSELLGEHWELIYPDDGVDHAREEILPTVDQDGVWHGESTGLRADGSTFVEDHTVVATDRGELVCTVRDMTSEKKQHEKYELITQASTDAFFDWDLTTDEVIRSEGYLEEFGYDASDLQDDTDWWRERVHPDDRDRVLAALAEALENPETTYDETYRFQREDGTYGTLRSRAYVIYDENDEPERMVGAHVDISELKEHERELEKRSAAMETSIDGMAILDADDEYVFVNQAHADIYGYDDPDDFLGETWRMCYDEDEIQRLETEVVPTLYEEGGWRGEAVGLRKDGNTFPQELSLSVTDDGGIICVVRDITDRRTRERAIEELHTTARTLMTAETPQEAADIVVGAVRDIFGMSVNGVFLHDETENVLSPAGWTEQAEDVIGDLPTIEAGEGLAWKAYESGEERVYDDVTTIPGRYNSDTNIRSELILPLAEHGVLIIGATEPHAFDERDLTLARTLAAHAVTTLERIDHRAELDEKSTLLDQLFEQVPVHLYIKDEDGRHLYVSDHYENVDPDETIGKTDEELYPDAGTYEDDMRVIEEEESIIDKEEYVPSADHWNVTSKVPWYDEDGEVAGLIGVTRRMTDRKEYEQQLERQNERLDAFARIVSHDLRSPLNVANGHLKLAQSECESDHLVDIAQAHERMETLIDDLLTLAREGKRVDTTESVALAETAKASWDIVETDEATLNIETGQPIQADPSRLKSLFENLFTNAVKHAGSDVTVTVGELDDENGFFVADDGSGIPEGERAEVFEAGYSTGDDGAGLGLHIVREIVEAHGWGITITDSGAGGSRFEITSIEVGKN